MSKWTQQFDKLKEHVAMQESAALVGGKIKSGRIVKHPYVIGLEKVP